MIPVLSNLFGFSGPDLWIVALVVVVLFGGSKVAGFGKNLGESLKEFKKATRDEVEPPPAQALPTPAPPPMIVQEAPLPQVTVPAATEKEQ